MNEVFEKILERLEESATCEDEWFCNYCQYRWCPLELIEREEVKKNIREVAKEYNNGWIPCSERLPDDFMSFEYLTIRKGHTLATITYYCVVNHKWYLSRNSSKEIDVIAWQPLPEPYKEK